MESTCLMVDTMSLATTMDEPSGSVCNCPHPDSDKQRVLLGE